MRISRKLSVTALTGAVLLLASACGSSSSGGGSSSGGSTARPNPPAGTAATSVGAGEGALNIIAWAGYAENGSTDPNVNWVKPFEDQTGCKVNVKIGNTSDEMVTLMKTGQYDGVSASGDSVMAVL